MILNKNKTLQRLDGFGRLYIPRKIQSVLNIEYNSVVTLELNDKENAIIIRKSKDRLHELHDLLSLFPNLDLKTLRPCELDSNWRNEINCCNDSYINCEECKRIFWGGSSIYEDEK